jgi:hypothetical protein
VADPSIFGDEEAEFLKELVRQKVDFMIVGLSAAALQGAPVVTQDVDLWFRTLSDPGIEAALKKVHGSYVPPIMLYPPMFAGDAVKLFDIVMTMDGLGDFDHERGNTIKLRLGRVKVLVLKLERIIASKEAAGRDKDKLVLNVLRDALKVIQERERSEDGTSQ